MNNYQNEIKNNLMPMNASNYVLINSNNNIKNQNNNNSFYKINI